MTSLDSLSAFGATYIALLPVAVFFAIAMTLLPSMLATSTPKPDAIVRAICCYMMKAFALLLIGISALVLLYNLMMEVVLPMNVLSALLLVLVTGVGLFIYFNMLAGQIDDVSKAVPRAIFNHGCIVLGSIIATVSGLSLLLTILLSGNLTSWQMPATLLLLSLLLSVSFSLHTLPNRDFIPKMIGKPRTKRS